MKTMFGGRSGARCAIPVIAPSTSKRASAIVLIDVMNLV
jgi:hypothetical protein